MTDYQQVAIALQNEVIELETRLKLQKEERRFEAASRNLAALLANHVSVTWSNKILITKATEAADALLTRLEKP